MAKEMFIVSACLAGVRCVNYPSLIFEEEAVKELVARGCAIPLCPEQVGGLATPRMAAGLAGGTAEDLWTGASGVLTRVVSAEGEDFTEQFMRGAREFLRIAQLAGVRRAIMHDASPSCGITKTAIHGDRGIVNAPGCGVVTWLLRANGVEVISHVDWLKQQGRGIETPV